jgi:hypothetical protein
MVLEYTQPLTYLYLLEGKGQPMRKADDLTVIVSGLQGKCESLEVLQLYGPSCLVAGVALRVMGYRALQTEKREWEAWTMCALVVSVICDVLICKTYSSILHQRSWRTGTTPDS